MTADLPRVLVVDDEPDTCANLADILSDSGYQVDTAHDGFAAIEKLQRNAYDLALLDLRMPGMDGLELYRRIRRDFLGTVAIIVTAFSSSETANAALSEGAWQILAKPVNPALLIALIGEACSKPQVLVVDDDHDLCASLHDLLVDSGYRVQVAHDVGDAEQLIRQRPHPVVLLDLKLPSGDGRKVLQTLEAADPESRVIVITGGQGGHEAEVEQALAEGADAVCYKPFNVKQLLSTMRDLRSGQARS